MFFLNMLNKYMYPLRNLFALYFVLFLKKIMYMFIHAN